ncbi:restriction endonuclease subunit S [Acinetobacter sp. ANC 4805]|uniref:restriction endonuclease subunit S n=1 Tax=Acinetobacter sp. ANC 4805 TaxID=2923425 RepID=UPI001F4B8726|nr:restriction endonuclease subunit S [Acinetobacter sp. ANC 4805]
MTVDWSYVRLKDYCTKIGSGSTPRGGANVYLDSGSVCLIRSQNIYNDGFSENGLVFISNSDAEKLNNVEIELNDVLINITGDSVARVCLAPKDKLPARVNQHVAIIRTVKNELDPKFVRYFLTDRNTQNHLLTLAGTGATRNALTKGMLEEFLVPKPDILIQKKISKILSDLDEKIHLNNQINQTLESIAQAIFKSWFIDFNPVRAKIAAKQEGNDPELAAMCAISGKSEAEIEQMAKDDFAELQATAALFPDELVESELGEVPKGWDATALGNFLEIKRGGSPRPIQNFMAPTGYPWVKIADATADPSPFLFKTKEFIIKEGLRKTVYLKKGSLILTNSATPGLPKFLELDACIHDGWLYFPQKQHFSDNYLYFLFLKLRTQLVAQGNGSVFTNLKTDILRNQVVLVPTKEVIEKFDLQVGKILEMMKTQCIQSSNLSDLRDALLPKLLSGELDVSGLQIEVA